MKRMYLLVLWLLPFLMLPIYSQAISLPDLSDSSRYVQFKSVADYKVYYVDMESITPITAPEGHRRITATVYALVDGEDYIAAVQMALHVVFLVLRGILFLVITWQNFIK